MRGVLDSSANRRKVGIVTSGQWSGWHSVASGLGWDIAFVVVGSGRLSDLWQKELVKSGILVVPYKDFSADLVATHAVEALLFEERIPPQSSALWQAPSLAITIGNSLPRRTGTPVGWFSKPVAWRHSDCGGVTSTAGSFHCVARDKAWIDSITMPSLPRRQLSSILSTTEGGRSIPPPEPAAWPPVVTPTTCPKGLGGIHADGLLPRSRSTQWVDMPDCLSRSGWVRRKLKLKELLTALDIPSDTQDSALVLSTEFQQDLFFRPPIGMLRLAGLMLNQAFSPKPLVPPLVKPSQDRALRPTPFEDLGRVKDERLPGGVVSARLRLPNASSAHQVLKKR
jgi:hypothetical protein